MKETKELRLFHILRALVLLLFVGTLALVYFLPGLIGYGSLEAMCSMANYELDDFLWSFLGYWSWIWMDTGEGVLTLFLQFCTICVAVLLWQGRGVLNNLMAGQTFCRGNAVYLFRAALCCFAAAGAAVIRLLWGAWYYGTVAPSFVYDPMFLPSNLLLLPVFLLVGLLLWAMSALFRQAAELKAENDLTI